MEDLGALLAEQRGDVDPWSVSFTRLKQLVKEFPSLKSSLGIRAMSGFWKKSSELRSRNKKDAQTKRRKGRSAAALVSGEVFLMREDPLLDTIAMHGTAPQTSRRVFQEG